MVNLYDVTGGTYHMVRTIAYPDFPESQIVTVADVKGKKDKWRTDITMSGMYNGPTDVTAVKDYKVVWSRNGRKILESGTATLVLSSGQTVRQVWSSTITPRQHIKKFPVSGEVIEVRVSPLEVKGNGMTYQWEGVVKQRRYQPQPSAR